MVRNKNKVCLFGYKRAASKTIKEAAASLWYAIVKPRWLGGMLD